MKKSIIAAIAAMALSCAAYAEDWIMITESSTGVRLLVDVDSYRVQTWTGPNEWLSAKFRYFGEGSSGTPFIYTTRRDACRTGNGELVYQQWDGTRFANTDMYWWSNSGQKMYDAAGVALCALDRESRKPTKSGTIDKST